MIVALQRLAAARAFEDDLAPAMTAYVRERANRAASVAYDNDRQVAETRREKIAGARNLSGMPHVLPRAMKDALLLSLKDVGIDVPSRRQRIPALDRTRD